MSRGNLPKERIEITYENKLDGALKKEELPFRVAVLGDFSGGTSKDRGQSIQDRPMREIKDDNLDATMRDMGINLSFRVPNVLAGGDEELQVDMPLEGMHSFHPDHLAYHVGALRTLMNMRDVLKEIRARTANDTDIVKLLEKLLEDPAAARRLARYELGKQPPASGEAAADGTLAS